MAVAQTTVTEIRDLAYVARSVKINQIRAEISYAKRHIVTLQSELTALKSAELQLMQKANRFVKLDTLQKYYQADAAQVSDPIQATRPFQQPFQDYDARVNWTQNQLNRDLEPLQTERDRIAAKIKNLTQTIRKYQKIYEDRMTEYNALGESGSQQVSQDNITKRVYSEVYMLYEVCKRYKDESTSPDGFRQFSYAPDKVKAYQVLSQLFQAYAERNSLVLDGTLKLNMDDPGSDTNNKALLDMLERLRKVLQDAAGEMDARLQKYVSQNESNFNDSFISQYLSRQATPSRMPDGTNAMSTFTANTATLVSRVNAKLDTISSGVSNKIYMFFDKANTKFADAQKKHHERAITALNGGKPYCTPVDKQADESNKDAATQQQQAADTTAAATFTTQLKNTQQVVPTDQIKTKIDNFRKNLKDSISQTSGLTTSANPITTIASLTDPANSYIQFTGSSLYHQRIVHQAEIWIDNVTDLWRTGNMTNDEGNAYVDEIQGLLLAVTPQFEIYSPGNSRNTTQ